VIGPHSWLYDTVKALGKYILLRYVHFSKLASRLGVCLFHDFQSIQFCQFDSKENVVLADDHPNGVKRSSKMVDLFSLQSKLRSSVGSMVIGKEVPSHASSISSTASKKPLALVAAVGWENGKRALPLPAGVNPFPFRLVPPPGWCWLASSIGRFLVVAFLRGFICLLVVGPILWATVAALWLALACWTPLARPVSRARLAEPAATSQLTLLFSGSK